MMQNYSNHILMQINSIKHFFFHFIMNRLKYSDSYSLSKLHREFGEIIKDLQINDPNPEREIVNWRKDAKGGYVEKYMRGQDKNPNYDEHKIESKLI